jgi:hypothetical protein
MHDARYLMSVLFPYSDVELTNLHEVDRHTGQGVESRRSISDSLFATLNDPTSDISRMR